MFDNATDYEQISILFVCIINRKNIVFLCPIVTIKCCSLGTIGQLMNETFIVTKCDIHHHQCSTNGERKYNYGIVSSNYRI